MEEIVSSVKQVSSLINEIARRAALSSRDRAGEPCRHPDGRNTSRTRHRGSRPPRPRNKGGKRRPLQPYAGMALAADGDELEVWGDGEQTALSCT